MNEEGFGWAVMIRRRVQEDAGIRGRLFRCTSARDALMLPEVHMLRYRHAEASAGVSDEGFARACIMAASVRRDAFGTLGSCLRRAWGAQPEAKFSLMLSMRDPDMVLRLLRAVCMQAEGALPMASTCAFLTSLDIPSRREAASISLAQQFTARPNRGAKDPSKPDGILETRS